MSGAVCRTSIEGSDNLGCFLPAVNGADIQMEVDKGLKVVGDILSCSKKELESRAFLLDKFLEYGIPVMDSPIFASFRGNMNAAGFGPIQFPTEFIDLLRRLISLQVKSALEIGTFRGGAAYFMAAVLQRACADFSLTMVDPIDNLLGFSKFAARLRLVKSIPSTSEAYRGRKFDFVFIDGAHDFESVMRDFENVGKFALKAIACHDIHGHEFDSLDGGTVKAWDVIKEKLRLECEVCEYAHSAERSLGIGVAIRC